MTVPLPEHTSDHEACYRCFQSGVEHAELLHDWYGCRKQKLTFIGWMLTLIVIGVLWSYAP